MLIGAFDIVELARILIFIQGNGISKNILRDLTAKHGECFARARRTVREHAAVVALEHYVDEIL